jgi:hypothetical protein
VDEEIDITPEMIAAGVARAKEFSFGVPLAELVEAIYLEMAIERRGYDKLSASPISASK